MNLGPPFPAASSILPGGSASNVNAALLGLTPDGVYLAGAVAGAAVGSYIKVGGRTATPTFSPLPVRTRRPLSRQARHRRCVFCGTFRGVTPPGR